ncbi:MAG: LLM class flavin-dependent oxidoreductase [Actinomycetota bacterium]|nr:LLM class flavin-dependent oxidoreductase [Actinomycetota bacterium]
MQFKFVASLVRDDLAKLPGWVRTVEDSGFDVIGLTDSPTLYPETYVSGVIVAQNISRVRFGPRVTNPITRHPMVAASAIGALDGLSDGRALFGIGAGDSAAHTAGARPAPARSSSAVSLSKPPTRWRGWRRRACWCWRSAAPGSHAAC